MGRAGARTGWLRARESVSPWAESAMRDPGRAVLETRLWCLKSSSYLLQLNVMQRRWGMVASLASFEHPWGHVVGLMFALETLWVKVPFEAASDLLMESI